MLEEIAKGPSRLDAALDLVSQGYYIFPLNGKLPLAGTHGFQDATQDRNQVVQWFKDGDKNIGIACGASGIIVLDVDPRNGGKESQRALEDRLGYGLADKTDLIVTTPSGGFHYYFKDEGAISLRQGNNKLGAGIDVKGRGGYVVAPGSDNYQTVFGSRASRRNLLRPLPSDIAIILKADDTPGVPGVRDGQSHASNIPVYNLIGSGRRNSELASIAGAMRARGAEADEIYQQLQITNKSRCRPPLTDQEVRNIARSYGRYQPGNLSASTATVQVSPICLATIQSKPVNWLWEPYIPLQTLTLLEGDPGVGKSYLSLELAARVTTGEAIANHSGIKTQGNVLYLTAEDSLEQTIRPRFDACGGDANHLYSLTELISLSDTSIVESLLQQLDPRLVIIDPIQAYLGDGVDMHRANHVRPILAALAQLAEKYNCAFLILRHLTKSSVKGAYKGMGSIDFRAAARSVLLVAEDPAAADQRVLIHSKYSLSKQAPALVYAVDQNGKVQWNGTTNLDESQVKTNENCSCGGTWVLKQNRSDLSKQFYGCSNYSTGCRNTKPYEEDSYL